MVVQRIGKVIQKERQRRGLSRTDLATHVGCAPRYISRIERGLQCPTLSSAERFATVFDVNLSELIRWAELDPDDE